jgi:hypothetical protein
MMLGALVAAVWLGREEVLAGDAGRAAGAVVRTVELAIRDAAAYAQAAADDAIAPANESAATTTDAAQPPAIFVYTPKPVERNAAATLPDAPQVAAGDRGASRGQTDESELPQAASAPGHASGDVAASDPGVDGELVRRLLALYDRLGDSE